MRQTSYIVEDHAASGERVKEICDEERLIAVTDRQVLTIEEGTKDDRAHRLIKSKFFTGPDVSGVSVERLDGKQYTVRDIWLGSMGIVAGIGIADWLVKLES